MANYNSFLFEGHGVSEVDGSYDPGASAQGARENDLVDVINKHAKSYLDKTSLKIHYDEQNYVDIDIAGNTYSSKAGATTHINAGGGNGVEIYVPINENFLDYEVDLAARLSKLMGIPNRGIRSRDYDTERIIMRQNGVDVGGTDYYKEIRDAWRQGVSLAIIEVGFIDTSDLSKMKGNLKQIGYEIARYICNICGVQVPSYDGGSTVTPPTTPTTPPVQNGAYIVRINNNAIYVLNGPSPDYDIVQTIYKGEVYTIVETKNGYGRLKSGAGWINLSYTSVVSGSKPPANDSSYKVQIVNNAIYVLNGPSPDYDIVQTIYKNEVYTIVETKNGYGKLKSGAGWINLKYTTRL